MSMMMIDDSALQFCRHSDYWKLLVFPINGKKLSELNEIKFAKEQCAILQMACKSVVAPELQ